MLVTGIMSALPLRQSSSLAFRLPMHIPSRLCDEMSPRRSLCSAVKWGADAESPLEEYSGPGTLLMFYATCHHIPELEARVAKTLTLQLEPLLLHAGLINKQTRRVRVPWRMSQILSNAGGCIPATLVVSISTLCLSDWRSPAGAVDAEGGDTLLSSHLVNCRSTQRRPQ